MPLEWVPLPMTAAPTAMGGQRLSQIVYEYEAPTPTGQHKRVTLEHTSTGGTWREAHFKRAASGPMSGAERAVKRRRRAALFPQKARAVRVKDVQRKQQAAAAKAAAAAIAAADQTSLEQQQQYWAERLEEEYWSSLATSYWRTRCCGFRMESPLFRQCIKACGGWGTTPCPGCDEMISTLPIAVYGLKMC